MKFSIVTISKNQGKFIEQNIKSVLKQNYKNYEHIIVDCVSNDETHKIIKKYKSNKLKVIIKKDKGPADGLNKGFKIAKGDIYYFLNADDYLLPNIFKRISAEFKSDKNIHLLISPGIIANAEGKIITKIFPSLATVKAFVNGACTLFQQGIFFTPNLFKKTNGFNINNKTCWDAEIYLNFLTKIKKKNYKRINYDTAVFRLHEFSISNLDNRKENEKINKRLFKIVYGKSKKKTFKGFLKYFILQAILDPKHLYKKIYNKIKYLFSSN